MGQGDWRPQRGRFMPYRAEHLLELDGPQNSTPPSTRGLLPPASSIKASLRAERVSTIVPNPWEWRLPSLLPDLHDVHPSTGITPVGGRRSLPASTLNPNPSVQLGEMGASLLLPRGALRNGLALLPTP